MVEADRLRPQGVIAVERAGQVIIWLTHASLVPEKRNAIAVFSKFNHTYEILNQGNRYAVNLPSREQTELAALFGWYSGKGIKKFEDARVQFQDVGGVPVVCDTSG